MRYLQFEERGGVDTPVRPFIMPVLRQQKRHFKKMVISAMKKVIK